MSITCPDCGAVAGYGRELAHRSDCPSLKPLVAPGFWMNETSGVLRPAVEAYLAGGAMSEDHVAAMRAYLRQWIMAPVWDGFEVMSLRKGVDKLTSRAAIHRWLDDALRVGIDPL